MIPEADGVAHAIDGDIFTAGSAHNLFHKSLESFWDLYRKNGSKFGQNPTCGEYGKALEKALQAAGKSVDESVALAEVANKNRQFYGLLDDDLVPDIPDVISNLK